ncbi:MAG TPA: alpha-galactosidase [Propionicimonas sp.]|uniref:alpha-galactosidase n=1 Tax=Propionicimonas sp. TaxID=1955623 RepID=UPI002F3FD4E4
MSWELATATGRYVIDLAPDGVGPVLQDWTGLAARPWLPEQDPAFLTEADRLPLEFSALGTRHVRGAELVVEHPDGIVGARLTWPADGVSLTDDGYDSTFTALAVDTTGRVTVMLVIAASRDHDVVSKHAVVTNTGDDLLFLRRAFSPAWHLPVHGPVEVDVLAGHWSREFTPATIRLPAGELSIGSRQGITSHDYSPVVAVTAAENRVGPAWGVALAWSGSWRLLVDVPPFRSRTRVAAGVDDESSVITLEPGQSYTTPHTLGVHAPDGADGLRRRWHDYQRTVLARSVGPEHRPIVYNSWYATTFDVRPEQQLALADRAAALGVEAFVIDDGWFAGRDDDRGGLGDWWPDGRKFPDGLDPLISGVLDRGMRFGIWVEPEAVSPASQLFAAHPDWVYRAGDRPLITIRNQYVLDFGRQEVVEWAKGWLRDLLSDSRITYLKWDMNRPVTDGGRPGDLHGREWAIQHAEGYHAVMRMLREEFPHVTVEACSGGGGRIDASVLAISDVVWPSDETGPRDRLAIQHGFLSAYSPHVMSSWVTDQPDRLESEPASLEFRFLVAMAGVLGVGADLGAWTPAQLAIGTDLVQRYREIRETVHTGRVEPHGSPTDPVYAVEYGREDQTAILVFGRGSRPNDVRVRPKTLVAGARYRVNGRTVAAEELSEGLTIDFALAADADLIVLDRVG